jgi:hypothetical protein
MTGQLLLPAKLKKTLLRCSAKAFTTNRFSCQELSHSNFSKFFQRKEAKSKMGVLCSNFATASAGNDRGWLEV